MFFAKWTICFSCLVVKYSFITKHCMLRQFGNGTWNVLPTFIFCSFSSLSPSHRMSLSIAKVIFQEQSTYSCSTATHIPIEHTSQNRWHIERTLIKTKNSLRANSKRMLFYISPGVSSDYDKKIPIWYEVYHNLSQERTSYTTVLYSPISDANPVGMATTYTTIWKC